MNRFFRLAACCSIALAGGAAFAQQPPSAPPPPPNPMGDDPTGRIPQERNINDLNARLDWTQEAAEKARAERGKGQIVDAQRPHGALRARAAKAQDVVSGATVTDMFGNELGTIASVAANEAIVTTLAGPVRVPVEAFGKTRKGLLVDMTRKAFEQLVAQANAPSAP